MGFTGGLYSGIAGSPAGMTALRGGLVASVVFAPAAVMGATLPLFVREFVREDSRLAGGVGLLYGINTAGAAAGCIATGTGAAATARNGDGRSEWGRR